MKPIIEIVTSNIQTQVEEGCLRACQNIGITVDKERLIQALTDASKFYDEGYTKAKLGMSLRGQWTSKTRKLSDLIYFIFECSECKYESLKDFNYCPSCGVKMKGEN